jgi:hypothetical protein
MTSNYKLNWFYCKILLSSKNPLTNTDLSLSHAINAHLSHKQDSSDESDPEEGEGGENKKKKLVPRRFRELAPDQVDERTDEERLEESVLNFPF